MLRIMTEIDDTPVLSFTTAERTTERPSFTFELDGRMVTARAPKASWWTSLWLAQAEGDAPALYRAFREFVRIALGADVALWLLTREKDLDDPYDLPDLIRLVEFMANTFGPMLQPEFEAAGTVWQPINVTVPEGTAAVVAPRAKAGTTAAKPRKAAKKTAARRG